MPKKKLPDHDQKKPWQEVRLGRMTALLAACTQEELAAELDIAPEITAQDGRNVELRANPGDPEPTVRLTKNPDGTLSISSTKTGWDPVTYAVPKPGRRGGQNARGGPMPDLLSPALLSAAERLLRTTWNKGRANKRRQPPDPDEVRTALKLSPPSLGPDHPAETAQITDRFNGEVARLVDLQAWSNARKDRARVTVARYNTMLLAQESINQLKLASPGAAAMATARGTITHTINHPGQLTDISNQVMDDLGIPANLRKKIRKLPENTMLAVLNRNHPPLAQQSALIAATSIDPAPTPDMIRRAMSLCRHIRNSARHRRRRRYGFLFNHLAGRGPNHNPAAMGPYQEGLNITQDNQIRAVTLLLKEGPNQLTRSDQQMGMSTVADYMAAAADENTPLRSNTWNRLRRQADHWHQELQQQHNENRNHEQQLYEDDYGFEFEFQGLQAQPYHPDQYAPAVRDNRFLQQPVADPDWAPAWNTLVELIPCRRDLLATALTSDQDLCREARQMSHCIYTYTYRCVPGNTRVFTITRNRVKIGTVAIQLRGNSWEVEEAQGPKNKHSQDVEDAAEDVARAYTRVWKKAPEPKHVKLEKHATTGETRPVEPRELKPRPARNRPGEPAPAPAPPDPPAMDGGITRLERVLAARRLWREHPPVPEPADAARA